MISYSEKILKAIGEAYYALQSNNKIKEAIPEILELLGKATLVDRAYIFQNHLGEDGELRLSQKYEWAAEGVTPQIDFEELQDVPWSVFPIVAEKLGRNMVINEVLNEESNGKDFYDTMAEQGILSFLFIPIMVDRKFWGFMGFDNCSSKEIYSDEQVAALHAFASTLGYTILAKRQKKRLLKAKESYSFLVNNVNEVIFKLDQDCNWSFLNRQWQRITNFSVKSTLGTSFKDSFKKKYQEEICASLDKLYNRDIKKLSVEAELLVHNEKPRWVKIQATPQFNSFDDL